MKSKPPKVLHLISQAHLDPVWLWPWRDGCAEALTTIQSAVDRAQEFPGFQFTRSSAAIYRWVQQIDPPLFGRLRRLVRQKRWEMVGGWIEQPDCNLPSTESFVRQALYGKEYFARVLKTGTRIGYNPDSFGHAGGLPQLLKQAGFDYYVFMRPDPREAPALPPVFWWESDDGSRVLALQIPVLYCQSPAATADSIEASLRAAEAHNFPGGFQDGVFFLGVGNHGGGPTRRHLERITALQGDPALPQLRFSTLSAYFQALERTPGFARRLPVVRGELQHHARGCYAAAGEIKALNRRAEQALVTAEMACRLAGGPAPRQPLADAWWRLLFNQFHDILAGSCTAQVWEETVQRFGSVLTAAREITVGAVYRLARRVDTRREAGSVLFACNVLPWERTALVQWDTFRQADGAGAAITHLQDSAGQLYPIQWLPADAGFGPHGLAWGKLTARVPVPAGGYRTFRLVTAGGPAAAGKKGGRPPAAQAIRGLSRRGLASLKVKGVELLAGPVALAVFRDESDTWSHGVDVLGEEAGSPALTAVETLESGPLLTIVRHHYTWQASTIRLDVSSCAGSAVIGLRVRCNWQEKRQLLRLQVPTRLRQTAVVCQTAGGTTRRAATAGEEPCQAWVALEGRVGERAHTLCVLNAGSYSYEAVGGLLRLLVVRSAPFAEHAPLRLAEAGADFLDQGWQERRFWLLGYAGQALAQPLSRLALDLQTPLECMLDSGHRGNEPWEKSMLAVSPASVVVLAWKEAEKGGGTILRLQESAGRRVAAVVSFPDRKHTLRVALGAWEIATLRIRSKGGTLSHEKTNLLEE